MNKPGTLSLIVITAVFVGVILGFIFTKHAGNTTVIFRNYTSDEQLSAATADSDIIRKININTATAEQLEILPGIGKDTAEKIIQYRTTNGMFVVLEDLLKIKGFGKSSLEKIRNYITVQGG